MHLDTEVKFHDHTAPDRLFNVIGISSHSPEHVRMAVWQIQLLGGLRATHGNSVIAQFPSRPIAMLLALLAMQPQRRHAREELIELLWPDVELDVGRNRLRQV